jgi:hypothetical protein
MYSPPMPRPPTGDCGVDGVICWSGIWAVTKDRSRSLRLNAVVCSRVNELLEALSAGAITLEISKPQRARRGAPKSPASPRSTFRDRAHLLCFA